MVIKVSVYLKIRWSWYISCSSKSETDDDDEDLFKLTSDTNIQSFDSNLLTFIDCGGDDTDIIQSSSLSHPLKHADSEGSIKGTKTKKSEKRNDLKKRKGKVHFSKMVEIRHWSSKYADDAFLSRLSHNASIKVLHSRNQEILTKKRRALELKASENTVYQKLDHPNDSGELSKVDFLLISIFCFTRSQYLIYLPSLSIEC